MALDKETIGGFATTSTPSSSDKLLIEKADGSAYQHATIANVVRVKVAGISTLSIGTYPVSDPPTQAEVQAIAAGLVVAEAKLNELINALKA